jgi:hypothetical protein
MNDVRDVRERNAETDAGVMPGLMRDVRPSFGGLSPREAAQLRWSKERERHEGEEDDAELSDAETRAQIIDALKKKARAGDEAAARELRNWLPPLPADPSTLSELEALERDKRALLSRVLLLMADVGWDEVERRLTDTPA